MSRIFVPITVNELKSKIEEALGEDGDYRTLTPTVEKDLDKVNFSTENLESQSEHGYGPSKDLVGYHMLSNGLAILGITAGGDWEFPIFFCIYFDGKKLRAYIPEQGNTWNTDTNEAFGNDNVADLKNARKRWPSEYPPDKEFDEDEDVEPIGNVGELKKDIISRITKKAAKQKYIVVKLTLEPTVGWDKNALATLINSANGCNIPGLGGNVYQGQRVIAQVSSIEISEK